MHPKNRSIQKPIFGSLLLTVIIIIFFFCSIAAASEKPIILLDSHGPLFEQKENSFKKVKETRLAEEWKRLRVGEAAEKDNVAGSPEKLAEAHSVLMIGKRTLLTLANGTELGRSVSEKEQIPLYHISGTAHFLVNEGKTEQPVAFFINNLKIQTQKLHLFYNGLSKTPQLTVIEGSVEITLPVEKEISTDTKAKNTKGETADSTGKENAPETAIATGDATTDIAAAKPGTTDAAAESQAKSASERVTKKIVLETVKLNPMDRIVIEKKGYRIEKKTNLKTDAFLLYSTIPGFESPGPYRPAGKVGFERESLQIKRYGKTSVIKQSPALLMEGDQLHTSDDQSAIIQLTDKDIIRLSQNTTFSIDAFNFKAKTLTSVLGFAGKVRARIAKRKKRSQVRFKTATAVIGIKGTVFESSASADVTTVETVQGTVGVSDPKGQGEVSVKAGEKTSVAANGLPTEPEPIPSDRWQQLQKGLIPVAAATAVPLNHLRILSPADGQTYTIPVLTLEIDPEDATLIFQLDGQPFVVENGDTLHYLSEGPHQLVVKGTDDETSQTVSFTIDRTAPDLSPASQLEGFILRQFKPITLFWTEPLASLNVLYNNAPLPVTVSEDGKSSVLDSSPIFVNTTNGQMINLVFETLDKSGNNNRFEKSIQIKYRPSASPFISIEDGKQFIHLKDAKTITAVSNREIEQWTILLDQQPLALPPQTTPPDSGKKLLIIPPGYFSQLTEGKHVLKITGTDDFGLIGRQSLELIIDKTPAVLQQPLALLNPIQVMNEARLLMLENLVVKEGESLMFNWSEPVSSVTFMLTGIKMPIPLVPSENKKASRLDASHITQFLGTIKSSPIKIEVKDAAGNITQLQGNIRYLPKPDSPPAITVATGSGKLALSDTDSFKVTSDRNIFQWHIFLNDKEIVRPSSTALETGLGSKQIELQKNLFPELTDGSHRLIVKGTDRFNLNGIGELTFSIDNKSPEMLQMSKSIKMSSFKLRKDEMLHLKWSEKLSAVEAVLADKPWTLILSADRAEVIIKGDADKLSYEPKEYKLIAFDLVGNRTQIQGRIALRKPRKMALEDSYNDSILDLTRTSIDKMTLTNRPKFQLNNAKPVMKSENSRILDKIEFKQNIRTEFFDYLDEPLTNSY